MKFLLTIFIMFGAWCHLYSFGEEAKKPKPEAKQEAAPKAVVPDSVEPAAGLTEEEKAYNFCLASGVMIMYNHTSKCLSYEYVQHQQSGSSEAFSPESHGHNCFKLTADYYIKAVEECKNSQEEPEEPAKQVTK
jgi:hypothetical protein